MGDTNTQLQKPYFIEDKVQLIGGWGRDINGPPTRVYHTWEERNKGCIGNDGENFVMLNPNKHSNRTRGCKGGEWGMLELVTSLAWEVNMSEEIESGQSVG